MSPSTTVAKPVDAVSASSVNMFVEHVSVLDYAYFDAERGILGNSYHVDAELIGHLDDEGVVFDFSYAKKAIKGVIDSVCDHRLVIPGTLSPARSGENMLCLTLASRLAGTVEYRCPEQGICQLSSERVTCETLTHYLETEVMRAMPKNVDAVRLHLEEESFSAGQPVYHYSHGLKQHYGNCQRLFHGHRNKLDIYVDGEKDPRLENELAGLWRDIHFAFPENIVDKNLRIGQRQSQLGKIRIRYQGQQGTFEAVLPGQNVYVMPYETTVENIARHMLDKAREILNRDGRRGKLRVRAFEGIAKGAEVHG